MWGLPIFFVCTNYGTVRPHKIESAHENDRTQPFIPNLGDRDATGALRLPGLVGQQVRRLQRPYVSTMSAPPLGSW